MFTPKFLAKTPMLVQISEGIDENGAPAIGRTVTVKARLVSTNSIVYGTDGQKITLSRKAFVFEDFEHFYVGMSGKVTISGEEHDIAQVACFKNPDDTVNYYMLGLV